MDRRLLACSSLCVGRRIADIGTDHGYLPCYMVSKGLCDSALACDVGEKPLESAVRHITESGLGDRIEAVLSNGLEKVPLEGVSDIVIAGMGGELIADILGACNEVASGRLAVNLVLQPMTKWDVLRRWLYEHRFEITAELPCEEGRFVYSVMQARYTGKKPPYPCDLRYLYCGRVTADTPEGREYLKRQAKRLEAAGKGRSSSPQTAGLGREMLLLAEQIMCAVK